MTPVPAGTKPRCAQCGGALASRDTEDLCPLCLFDGVDLIEGLEVAESEPAGERAPAAASLLPIQGYTVVAELARGGMGIVYRARQWAPAREVALKMLLPLSAASPELRERFQLEARTLSELDHPAILPIYETGEHDGLPWFSMKLAAGGSLAAAAPTFRGRWRDIAELMATLADAVQFAHEHGVLHRDLKPGNILFDAADRPFVADFGLAKLMRLDGMFTRSHLALGTPHYLAPEVAASSAAHATIASDVYGLGAILFELLAGRPPFEAEGVPELMRRIAEDEPGRLRGKSAGDAAPIPRDLEVIALKCLAKSPGQRYASARELGDELRRWNAGEPIFARPAGAGEKIWRWARRNPALAASLAACVVIAVAGVAGILRQLAHTEAARAEAERSELVMRQNLYAADMLTAQRALALNDLGGARRLLDAHRPPAGQADLRGWEWRHFWAQARPRNFLTLPHPGNSDVVAIAFTPDGSALVSATLQVLVHDTATWQLRHRLEMPNTQSLAFLPGKAPQMFIGNKRAGVHFWDGQYPGMPPPALIGLGRWPNVAISPRADPLLLAIGVGDNASDGAEGSTTLHYVERLDDFSGGTRRVDLPDSGGNVAFSPDGGLLATGSWQNTITLWDPTAAVRLRTLADARQVDSMRFSPDGRTLVVCSRTDGVWLYEVATGARRPFARGHGGRVFDAEFSPDGRLLATAGGDQTVRVWDVATGRQTELFLGHSYAVLRVAWSPDGAIVASGGNDGVVRLWRLGQADKADERFAGRVDQRLFSRDGRRFAVNQADGRVALHAYPGMEVVAGPHPVGRALGFGAEGDVLFSLRQRPGAGAELVRWSVPDFRELGGTPVGGDASALQAPAVSADGRWFAAGMGRRVIGLWDLSSPMPEPTRLIPAPPQTNYAMLLAFSPDSRRLAASCMDSTSVHVWDLGAKLAYLELPGHKGYVLDFKFHPDNRTLISGDGARIIKIWDVVAGKEVDTMTGLATGTDGIAVSPDGRTVASTTRGTSLRLWHLATRREIARFDLGSTTHSVAFAPDGSALLVEMREAGAPVTRIFRAPGLAEADAATGAPR